MEAIPGGNNPTIIVRDSPLENENMDRQSNSLISVIIPTTCETSRSGLLRRAIGSIKTQEFAGGVEILLICNGNRQDLNLLAELESYSGLRIVQLEEGNVSKARYVGVRNVRTEFYCFLDDDDELLPDCLLKRLEVMRRYTDCDVVVTNGMIHCSGIDSPLVSLELAATINSDLYGTFLRQNWFASPASMFRTKSLNLDVFDFSFKYFEWTYLLFSLLSLKKNFFFDTNITYRKYEDNPLSVSKTIEYSLAYPEFLLELKRLDLPTYVKAAIHEKYLVALNARSNIYRMQGQWLKAWQAHLSCLAQGGVRYFSYTRHLLLPNSK